MIRRPPRSTHCISSAASDVYKRQKSDDADESTPAEQEILHDINLSIPSGATVGIVGATGSGKSSLVQLIARLYDVSSGTLFVGGKDIRNYDSSSLRNEVGFVLQKNILFNGTIAENLRWGRLDLSLIHI